MDLQASWTGSGQSRQNTAHCTEETLAQARAIIEIDSDFGTGIHGACLIGSGQVRQAVPLCDPCHFGCRGHGAIYVLYINGRKPVFMSHTDVVLILGSGPNAPLSVDWPKDWVDRLVVINNAWRIRPDWDDLVFPEDFPAHRRPETVLPHQRLIEADAFVPAQNAFGGFVYAGGTMAFTAAYWALHALRPKVLAFFGCDMVYPEAGPTHFYGSGTADPLRDDVTLRDLKAKSARLGLLAALNGCACVNLSEEPSQLVFDRARPEKLRALAHGDLVTQDVSHLLDEEKALNCFVPSGRYWEVAAEFDAVALERLDAGWRTAWQRRMKAVTAAA